MNATDHIISIKELLAKAINVDPNGQIINELFRIYPTIPDLLEATEFELTAISGVGVSKARQIVSAISLSRNMSIPMVKPYIVRSPADVVKLVQPEIGHLKHEVFMVLFLNVRNHVMDKEILGVGSLSSCIVHPREIFRAAIRRASASIICVHNHPGSSEIESSEDIAVSRRLKEVGELIGIELLDSIIVTAHGAYRSLKEQGHI